MKGETAEWVEKAEGDLRTAQRELAVLNGQTTTPSAFMLNSAPRSTSKLV